jgi:uncharacterized protein YdiU (UPF0061 family)
MSILGLTIDYGPFGFMEDTDLNFICNHSDESGRYAYGQQPGVAHWNLSRLFVCFMEELSQERLQEMLNHYPEIFQQRFMELGKKKLGLTIDHPDDGKLFLDLLQVMGKLNLDFTFTFRSLSTDLHNFREYYGKRAEFEEWFARYETRLSLETVTAGDRRKAMCLTNPKYVLRNYIAQEVIDDVEAGSSALLEMWLGVLYNPFDEHPRLDQYARPTPVEKKHIVVSCSS